MAELAQPMNTNAGASSSSCDPAGDVIQVTSLPNPALQQIVKRVASMGQIHLCRLRLCSRSWRVICNAEAMSFSCDSDQLTTAVSAASSLPLLRNFAIQRSKGESCKITSGVLSSLEARNLEVLVFKGSNADAFLSSHKMVVEDLGKLLLPWSQSLQTIHLVCCRLPSRSDVRQIGGPSFFSKFPQLRELKLQGVTAEPPLTSLDLQGCNNLCNLDCHFGQLITVCLSNCKQLTVINLIHNKVSALDLSGCDNLAVLRCASNRLVSLDLSACAKLKWLACSSNRLVKLDLSSCAGLKDLTCTHNPQLQSLRLHDTAALNVVQVNRDADGLVLSGGASIHTLQCDPSCINLLAPRMRAQLHFLEMWGVVHSEVAGFEELSFLDCTIGPTGLIDLTGCIGVYLSVHSAPSSLLLNGCTAVTNLALWGDVNLLGLERFTSLTGLAINVTNDFGTLLDLSVCPSLIKLWIGQQQEGEDDSAVFDINLSGSSSMTELVCAWLPGLENLDLSSCVALTKLTAKGTRLKRLDVSSCALLTRLDVSSSELLETVKTHKGLSQKNVIHEKLSTACHHTLKGFCRHPGLGKSPRSNQRSRSRR